MSNSENKKIKELETRVLSSKGKSLFDLELLEAILHSAYNEIESKEVSERLMDLFSNLGKIYDTDLFELKNVTGMNDIAIASIFSVRETLERILKGEIRKLSITDYKNRVKLIKYLRIAIGQSRKEHLRAMYFDQSCCLVHEYIQDLGTVNNTPFYVREIIKIGLLTEATSLIISHNHPTGRAEPSEEDQKNTKELNSTCDKVGIKLIDHIIITKKGYFSFFDNGLF